MSHTDDERTNADSLAAEYWDAVTRHRSEVERLLTEDPPRHRPPMPDFQSKMSRIVDRLLEASKSASPDVWFAIGDAYQMGAGTAKNREQGLRWFQKAAEAGHVRAMVRLGNALKHTDHPETWSEGVRWLQRAADGGDASAMAFLGFAYREGKGVAQNYNQALSWFIKAVTAGDTHSVIHVGRVLARHLDSPAGALGWFLQAAEQGHRDSFVELAMLYDQPGTPVHNPAEAVRWYKIVEKETGGSQARAMMALATHCLDGDGTPRDLLAASEWLRKLMQITREKSKEHRAAAKMLKRISSELKKC